MTYCTAADVRVALTPGGTGDDNQTAASLTDWQLIDAIEEAEGLVNSYLGGFLPLTPVEYTEDDNTTEPPTTDVVFEAAPNPVRRWTRTVAAYLAALTFRRNKDLANDDPIVRRYELTLKLLEDVRAGLVILPPDLFPPTGSGYNVEIFNQYQGTLFGPEDFNLGPAGVLPRTYQVYLYPDSVL